MAKSFFTSEDGEWFIPTEYSRGPWHIDHCHAGPPSGLAARAMEQLLPSQRLTRLTIELIRPIPHAGFNVVAELTRQGRSVSTAVGSIVDADGVVRATFSGLLMASLPDVEVPTHHSSIGRPEDAISGEFPIVETAHGQKCFTHAVEMKYPVGQQPTPGPTSFWMRAPPLLDNAPDSPFQSICPLADCGNAFGRNANPWDVVTFANADLSVVLHRAPKGEWLGGHAVSYWESSGIGMSDMQLFDRHGSVGRALQTLVLRPPKLN